MDQLLVAPGNVSFILMLMKRFPKLLFLHAIPKKPCSNYSVSSQDNLFVSGCIRVISSIDKMPKFQCIHMKLLSRTKDLLSDFYKDNELFGHQIIQRFVIKHFQKSPEQEPLCHFCLSGEVSQSSKCYSKVTHEIQYSDSKRVMQNKEPS